MKNERNTQYRLGQEHRPCFASIRGGIETRPTSCSTTHCCVTLGGDSTSLSLTLTGKVGLVAVPVSRVGETHLGLYVWHSLTEHGLRKPCSQVRGACTVNRTWFQELGGEGGSLGWLENGSDGPSEGTAGSASWSPLGGIWSSTIFPCPSPHNSELRPDPPPRQPLGYSTPGGVGQAVSSRGGRSLVPRPGAATEQATIHPSQPPHSPAHH